MSEILSAALLAMSGWELLAVLLGVAYLVLATRQSQWCWYAAFASTGIYLFLFWHVNLFMESALQIYYLAMACYGWWQWRGGNEKNGLPISRWNLRQHSLAAAVVVIGSSISGYLLQQYSEAAWPYLDSFTTWGSVLTTWMVARKVLENWLYWLLIDSISIVLYLERELYLTAGLFAVYLVIIVFGYRQWLRSYQLSSS